MTPNLGQGGCTALEVCLFSSKIRNSYILVRVAVLGDSHQSVFVFGEKIIPVLSMSYYHLQDAVVLAQFLRDAAKRDGANFARLPFESIEAALRAYEQKRSLRVTKITVRSHLMGRILGIHPSLFCAALLFQRLYDCFHAQCSYAGRMCIPHSQICPSQFVSTIKRFCPERQVN